MNDVIKLDLSSSHHYKIENSICRVIIAEVIEIYVIKMKY